MDKAFLDKFHVIYLPLFKLGRLVATPGALEFLEQHGVEPATLLDRHIIGDWGDLCAEDKELNDLALNSDAENQGRLFSSYNVADGKVWIITEWDRSYTTILLPEEH